MPHIHIDHSPNAADRVDMASLCEALAEAAVATGIFPRAGIRVRAVPAATVWMADGNPDHAYADITIRIGAGRSAATRSAATDAIFEAARAHCARALASGSFMLSCEMREIDPALSRKTSSIRDHLPPGMH